MWGLRLGDDIDDFCVKCKRVTNHNVLAIVDDAPAKVRCRTCYHEQEFRDSVAPPSKRELKKAAEAAAEAEAKAGAEAESKAAAAVKARPAARAAKPKPPRPAPRKAARKAAGKRKS
jgi:hypothetical protein